MDRTSLTGVRQASSIAEPFSERWRRGWLTLRVHVDALLLDRTAYLKAVAWRIRGLKVRSRNGLAPLIGRSRHAYPLWMSRNEGRARAGDYLGYRAGPVIVPVIDCRAGSDGLGATILSLNKAGLGSRPVLIGGPVLAEVERVEHPSKIGKVGEAVWLCPLSPGDQLAPDALKIYSAAAGTGKSGLIYADDDLLTGELRSIPHFKPQWNPDLFRYHDFVTGASVVLATRDMLDAMPELGWAETLVAKALEQGSTPLHVPRILHHRIERPSPIIPAKPRDPLPDPLPLVSVIIPTRNHLALLSECMNGLKQCDYPRIETIVIDNDSDDPATIEYLGALERDGVTILRMPGAFNYSKLNNAAARQARGGLLCFLNNDVEMVESGWLTMLVRQAMRREVGAVGAMLLYPDRTIQHAGVFTGIGGGAGHGHRFQREDEPGYFERARLPQQVSAVTAACLVVAREKFHAVGGFDEQDFPVAFNDVDLCLKLNARGWQSFYEPRAVLIHHESKSRGNDAGKSNKLRFAGELTALKRKWRTDERADPYHHPHLSRFSEQFLIAV